MSTSELRIRIGADGRIGVRDGAVISASRAPAITAGDQVLLDVVWATGSGTTGRVFYRCTNVTNPAWNGGAPFFWDSGATRTLTAINRVAAGVVDVLAIPAPGVRIEKLGAESITVNPNHTSQAQAQTYFADPPVQEVPLATPSPVVTAIKQPTTTGGSDGTITVGKYADLVVLDRNIYDRPLEELCEAQVDLTMVEGEIVFQR